MDDSSMDGDGDDGMDDDMMDKISSSPSIEDGGSPSTSQPVWPRRVDSLRQSPPALLAAISDARRNYPYLLHPESAFPNIIPKWEGKASVEPRYRHHHPSHGEYNIQDQPISDDRPTSTAFDPSSKESHLQGKGARTSVVKEVMAETYRQEQEALTGAEDVSEEQAGPNTAISGLDQQLVQGAGNIDEGIAGIEYEIRDDTKYGGLITLYDDDDDDINDLTIPYEGSDEDDDGEFPDVDPRFIAYGFDAECLQNTEDIDFEFVYALHTFVATVEGQANATKGDTMVLLDDSNSYWWLVRVVKDSSIGEC
jgi:hypothetical protein